ncbi:MAG: 16S rRNA (adenine(1518)-N(6)/adenine(1519)-N(6))-dimethyltransferase RsmA [Deltaproteobacteria bacterium]|nr:16S rRNA (adenine(1518)-N(6)/adenine(1519)-N(6))-dimethyltransferase RsmA [Deltaproteobacteria bacterium]
MTSVRTLLNEYDVRPRKSLGQSFLNDGQMIRRIAVAADPQQGETIVEIGAGLGLLTEELARKAGRVIALEIDPRLVRALKDRFANCPTVEIVPGDVLDYDFSKTNPGGRIKVVGNIPYHISTPILFRLLEYRRSIASMLLMFQKELAERIMAPPGKKDYGIPSVIVACYASVSRALTVPAGCFYPEPDVVSTVLQFVMYEDLASSGDHVHLFATVRAAFAQRRKTLRNNLRAAGVAEEALEWIFRESRIDGARRAETLSVGEFKILSETINRSDRIEKFLDKGQGI